MTAEMGGAQLVRFILFQFVLVSSPADGFSSLGEVAWSTGKQVDHHGLPIPRCETKVFLNSVPLSAIQCHLWSVGRGGGYDGAVVTMGVTAYVVRAKRQNETVERLAIDGGWGIKGGELPPWHGDWVKLTVLQPRASLGRHGLGRTETLAFPAFETR
jgi:hypothetical protein